MYVDIGFHSQGMEQEKTALVRKTVRSVTWHHDIVKAGAIPSVTGSHSGVQVDVQEKHMTETDYLLLQESGMP